MTGNVTKLYQKKCDSFFVFTLMINFEHELAHNIILTTITWNLIQLTLTFLRYMIYGRILM